MGDSTGKKTRQALPLSAAGAECLVLSGVCAMMTDEAGAERRDVRPGRLRLPVASGCGSGALQWLDTEYLPG